MWTWSLNWGEVTPHLIIGACPMRPGDLRQIHARAEVSGVLSLQHDDCLAYWGVDYRAMCSVAAELGVTMARCPIRDFDVLDMRRRLPAAMSMLADLCAGGRRTYVHCTAGLGRAPLTVLGYLILVEGYSPQHATELILAARPGAVPAWEAYYGCREDLAAANHEAIGRRAYELSQSDADADASANWSQAEAEILRRALTR